MWKNQQRLVTVVSGSQSAARAIMNVTPRPGQTIVYRVLGRVEALKEQQINIRLCWIPGHKGNIGNGLADSLAKQAVSLTFVVQPQLTKQRDAHRLEKNGASTGPHLRTASTSRRSMIAYRPRVRCEDIASSHDIINILWHNYEVAILGWRVFGV